MSGIALSMCALVLSSVEQLPDTLEGTPADGVGQRSRRGLATQANRFS